MTRALACRRTRLLHRAQRLEREASHESPKARDLAHKAAEKLRKEAARI